MPRTRLNPRSVGSLEPRSGRDQDYYWDTTQGAPSGFGVRVSAQGPGVSSRAYILAYRIHGRKRFKKLGMVKDLPLAKARDLARGDLFEIAKGTDPQARKIELREAENFEGFLAAFVETARTKSGREKSKATKSLYSQILNGRIRGTDLGRMPLVAVTRGAGEAALEAIAADAPILANRAATFLKSACEWGALNNYLPENPLRLLRRPKPEAERQSDRVLSPAEIKLAWEALDLKDGDAKGAPRIVPEPVAAATRLMLLLGTRRGETFSMRWQDVDLGARVWRIPGELRKGGEPLTVPLPAQAVAILEELILEPRPERSKAEGWAFVGPEGGCIVKNPGRIGAAVARAYKAACKAAKRKPEPWTFHDLRRTCATGCGELGAPPHVVALILGHKTMPGWGNVTAVYDRAQRSRDVAPWLQRWADRVEAIVTGQERKGADVLPLVRA